MTVHLVKLCVGADSVDDLENWVRERTAHNRARGLGPVHDHVTRQIPRRADELTAGGSLYWAIRGWIAARQRIVGLDALLDDEGVRRCRIRLDPTVVATEPTPRRAFQGWRYLETADAPRDLRRGARDGGAALRAELADLGLL